MGTDAVLASIDDTLAGYDGAVTREGPDAMRWVPERVICDGGKPLTVERKPTATLDAVRLIVIADVAGFRRQLTAAFETCVRAMRPVAQACEALGAAFCDGAAKMRDSHDRYYDLRHRPRCRTCNPAANPLPLPGGHEYRRRQRARQHRKARR